MRQKCLSAWDILTVLGLLVTAGCGTVQGNSLTSEIPSPIYTDPHYQGSADPEIIWNNHENEWWIFYTARRALRQEGTAAACPIGIARSKNLVNWHFVGYCKFDSVGGTKDADHTYWAPAVVRQGDTYHMFVTYKPGIEGFWGGKEVWIRHYEAPADDLLNGWTYVNDAIKTPDAIDAGLIKRDNQWLMYYRAKEGDASQMGTYWAVSDDLIKWQRKGLAKGHINDKSVTGYHYQEAQYPFYWRGQYWLLTDPSGPDMAVYSSEDAVNWKFSNAILNENGKRLMDQSMGRHPSVLVAGERAFIFYHVEPFRDYSMAYMKNKPERKRTCLQMAELEYKDGKVICNRDKTLRVNMAEFADIIKDQIAGYDKAVYIKQGWIRDPYIILAENGYYYLTGTTPLPDDPRQLADPYNTGLGDKSIVGWKAQMWRSQDLVQWEELGTPFTLKDGIWFKEKPNKFQTIPEENWRLWAPEIHWLGDRWVLVHTSPSPVAGANLALSTGKDVKGPWNHPVGAKLGRRHDPSMFQDNDIWYLLWGNTMLAPLNKKMSGFAAEPVRIDPAGSRPGPNGKPIRHIGHEGATIRKVGQKYVHFGTAWSTDGMRKGTYNLYYCTADKITGPYGSRKFAGRFLGHGTPFQDKQGRWWNTAFYNANVPPLSRRQIKTKDMSDTAYTINEQGVTIVPLDVKVQPDGDIYIRAIDPDYARPGNEEAQPFK